MLSSVAVDPMSEPQRAAADERPAAEEDRHTEEALMGALAELREIAGDLFELSQVQIERARIGVRSGIFTAGLATWMYVACIATSIVEGSAREVLPAWHCAPMSAAQTQCADVRTVEQPIRTPLQNAPDGKLGCGATRRATIDGKSKDSIPLARMPSSSEV